MLFVYTTQIDRVLALYISERKRTKWSFDIETVSTQKLIKYSKLEGKCGNTLFLMSSVI